MTAALIPERVEALRTITPAVSAHSAPSADTMEPVGCEVELISWAAGMPWSDHTSCVSPAISAFLRRYNDWVDEDARREMHLRVLDRLADVTATGGDGHDRARGYLAADWAVRVALPVWLDLAGASDAAGRVRALAPIVDPETHAAASRVVAPVREEMRELRRRLWAPLQAKVRDAVTAALKDRAADVAADVAAAVAAAAAVADAVAADVAVAAADAAAAAAAAVAADADADAVVAADADAVAAAAAVAADVAVAADDAVAAAAAAAAAAVAAAAAADAADAAADVAADVAVAAAVAADVAADVAAAVAVAAAAVDAVADAAAAADAAGSSRYWTVYEAVKEHLVPVYQQAFSETALPLRASALDLLDRMISIGGASA